MRTTCVRSRAHQQSWVLQPLVDAGLTADEIGALLVRLVFDDVVHADRTTPADAMAPVRDRSARVRAAWAETLDRMISGGPQGSRLRG
jgi:hypothetical protein